MQTQKKKQQKVCASFQLKFAGLQTTEGEFLEAITAEESLTKKNENTWG